MAFLELGERLRQRAQYAAAATVALAGLNHYPADPDAHDLLARIRADQGDDAAATAAWHAALECDADHVGARKGLAFVAFRAGDFVAAERHLDVAALRAPHDTTILAALDRVRLVQRRSDSGDTPRLTDPVGGVLLFDTQGLRLAGSAGVSTDVATADAASAEGASFSREAVRAARLLALGALEYVVIEAADARVAMVPVGAHASLFLHRSAATPVGRILTLAGRAAHAARDWLERVE